MAGFLEATFIRNRATAKSSPKGATDAPAGSLSPRWGLFPSPVWLLGLTPQAINFRPVGAGLGFNCCRSRGLDRRGLFWLGRHVDVDLEVMIDGDPLNDRDGAKRHILPWPGSGVVGN